MTVTEFLIKEIDAMVSLADAYGKEVVAEERRHADALQTILSQHHAQSARICSQTDARQRQLLAQRNRDLEELERQHDQVKALETKLSKTISRSRVKDLIPASQKFDEKQAQDLLKRIHEGGFWVWLKKLLSIGGYKTNTKMAADLYGQLDNAYQYLCQRKDATNKDYNDKIRLEKTAADKARRDCDSLRDQGNRNENAVHASKLRAVEQMKTAFLARPEIEMIRRISNQAATSLGATENGWKKYTPAKALPSEVLLGVMLHPCSIAAPSEVTEKLLAAIPGYVKAANGFNVPLTVPATQPVLIYTECDWDNVSPAAEVYQSVIGRMIRFMPMKSFRSVFFDPINRGTSLGKLIHLAGEGTSRLCEYHLSGQDIDGRMKKLTEHVDKVCNRLTRANVEDINVYNSSVQSGRIPYTAVVIHDYPQGLHSAALDALQVLINKAVQCGISIMISRKRGEKIEGRALEVLNQIRSEFIQINVGGTEKPSICINGGTYRFRLKANNISDQYLQEVNQMFTYKPPIVNDFSKFFDLGQLPAYRDSTYGLSIPFAVTGNGEMVDLKIGQDLTAYGLITGSAGSGKTTLLHMLITSAIMHYHASELELWLIDYKETEFARYVSNCPPHVRHVVADESSEISYSMIDEIQEECRRRKKLFTKCGVADYATYRKSSNNQRMPLPRLLVIIDEFHRMAQAAQSDTDYKQKLENIFAEARFAGITLLLCDQFLSNGLSGLSEKSRGLINVRIAMRNPVSEIRETLAVDSALITDQVSDMILYTSSGGKGTLLYKYEVENPDDPMGSQQVKFRSCRAIYVTEPEQEGCIAKVSKRIGAFDRTKTFFVGAKRERMDIPGIKRFEKQYPHGADQGNRFYIGTPLGIQPCFYLNHKPGESGENILLVGSNHEKRLSLLRSIISCAQRYGYKVNILAARRSQLYLHNKDFFNQLSDVNLITSFPEICQYVGQRANQLRALYSDDEEEQDVMLNGTEFTIFIGPDEMYKQMEASNLNQAQAWAVDNNQTAPEKQRKSSGFGFQIPVAPADFGSASLHSLLDGLDGEQTRRKPSVLEKDSPFGSLEAGIDDILAELEDNDEDDSVTLAVPERFAGSPAGSIRGYNAVEDLALLISDGWKLGLHAMLVLDKGTGVTEMRRIKKDGNFNHRIALVMSGDEARNFMAKTKVMQSLAEKNDPISAIYEYMGSREIVFRPYVF